MVRKRVGTFTIDPHCDVVDSSVASNRAALEMYQAFMAGYVHRINEATFNVAIGGIKIGSAKYTRLAQINLRSRVITFSRFAIENVPERGRRYLVIHELAHVKEPSHNKRFWSLVEHFEPHYRQIDRSLDLAFKRNVKEESFLSQASLSRFPNRNGLAYPISKQLTKYVMANINEPEEFQLHMGYAEDKAIDDNDLDCLEEEINDYDSKFGAISGG